MDDRQLMQMANDLASNFDKSLENGTLNDALQARDSFFETHQIQIDQKFHFPYSMFYSNVNRFFQFLFNPFPIFPNKFI